MEGAQTGDQGIAAGRNVGRSTLISGDGNASSVLNFQASADFLNQFYMLLVQVQLDVGKLDGKFERQSQQIGDMKLDVMSLKTDMLSLKQRVDAQQVMVEQRTNEMAGLKQQLVEVVKTTGAMRTEMEGITSKLSFRNRVELWVIGLVSVGLGLWVIAQQIW